MLRSVLGFYPPELQRRPRKEPQRAAGLIYTPCAHLEHSPRATTDLAATDLHRDTAPQSGLKTWVSLQAFRWSAMHRSPHAPHTMGPKPLDAQRHSVSQAQQLRLKARLPAGDTHVLCGCPPQALAEGRRWHRQAGRHYLGLRQGLPLPGWFFGEQVSRC